jgi:Cys-rich repeat protein
MRTRLIFLYSTLGPLACGSPSGGDTGTGTSAGDETFGMGVTSNTDGDPTRPFDPTTTTTSGEPPDTITATVTTVPPNPATDDVTSEPPDPSVSSSFTTDPDPTFTSTTVDPSTTTEPFPCNDLPGAPNGAECSDASGCGCASGACFIIPILGGLCGDCLTDADCAPGGCTIPDPLHSVGSFCNMGEPGAGCQSDEACSDPGFAECSFIIGIFNVFEVSTCSECASNADCPPDAPHCTPDYDLAHFSGIAMCRPDGSVPNGEGCSPVDDGAGDPLGNPACASGFCGVAQIMSVVDVGICGECQSNADCPNGQTCTDPQVDLDAEALVPAACI